MGVDATESTVLSPAGPGTTVVLLPEQSSRFAPLWFFGRLFTAVFSIAFVLASVLRSGQTWIPAAVSVLLFVVSHTALRRLDRRRPYLLLTRGGAVEPPHYQVVRNGTVEAAGSIASETFAVHQRRNPAGYGQSKVRYVLVLRSDRGAEFEIRSDPRREAIIAYRDSLTSWQ